MWECSIAPIAQYVREREWAITIQSHCIVSWLLDRLLFQPLVHFSASCSASCSASFPVSFRRRDINYHMCADEVFLPFRSRCLKRQLLVYDSLLINQCSICMYEYYTEYITKQHNPNHPPICQNCFPRLSSCPFCRIPLLDQAYLLEEQSISRYASRYVALQIRSVSTRLF